MEVGNYWLPILIIALIAWFFARKNSNKNNTSQGTQNYQQSQSQQFTQNTTMGETPSFCTNCGSKLTPGDKFCAGCGNKIG